MKRTLQYHLLLLALIAACNVKSQVSPQECRNTIKLDLIGVPATFLWIPRSFYPRASLEYERDIPSHQKLSWVVDGEFARFEETFTGDVSGQVFTDASNLQKNYSLIAGMRYYPFGLSNRTSRGFLFLEPRLSFCYATAKLNPHTIDDPVEIKNGFYLSPRMRLGVLLVAKKHVGIDLSWDAFLPKSLATEKRFFNGILEFNFLVKF